MTTTSSRIAALLSAASALALAHSAWAADAPADSDKDVTVQAVIVTAPRDEVRARQEQHEAINLINVQPAETIQKYPDFNAAEALGRMPGVSISTDTGEGGSSTSAASTATWTGRPSAACRC
jgi:outer membrane cobalamin receptor